MNISNSLFRKSSEYLINTLLARKIDACMNNLLTWRDISIE